MPSLEALYNRYSDRNFKVLAINSRETLSQVSAFMEEYEYTFTALLDEDGRVTESYGVPGFPTVFVVDANSMIAVRIIGGYDWDSATMQATIESLLD